MQSLTRRLTPVLCPQATAFLLVILRDSKWNAIVDDVTNAGAIGLDAEWNIRRNGIGHQLGKSKIQKIQIAYCYGDDKNGIQVVIFRQES